MDNNDLSQRLSTRLANFKLNDDVIKKLAGGVMVDGLEIKRFDVCAYGICIDYFGRVPKLDGLLSKNNLAHLEVYLGTPGVVISTGSESSIEEAELLLSPSGLSLTYAL